MWILSTFWNKRIISLKVCIILSLLTFHPVILLAADYRIDMFSPALESNSFWKRMKLFSKAAADDLNIDLRFHFVDYDRNKNVDQVKTLLSSQDKTDGIIFQSLKKNGALLIQLAEKYQTPAILFNAGLDTKTKQSFGAPRQKYKYWLGELLPDDEDAGYQLAIALIERAKQLNLYHDDRKIHLFGIIGAYAEGGSFERVRGFKRAVQSDPSIKYFQHVQGYWSQERAKRKALGLFKRYPTTRVVWTANDPMALGVIEAAEIVGKIPGKNLLVGGVDWTESGIQAIEEKKMVTSVGGHFMDGAWSLVLFFDYLNGQDFKTEKVSYKSKMKLINRKNLKQYRLLFRSELWSQIDFKRFSKYYNPSIKTYDFSIGKVLAQLK